MKGVLFSLKKPSKLKFLIKINKWINGRKRERERFQNKTEDRKKNLQKTLKQNNKKKLEFKQKNFQCQTLFPEKNQCFL